MPETPPKEIIAGRYRMIERIGKGGMGTVWRAEHTSLKTPVAVKILDPALAEREGIRARFLREAQAAASLKSAHVVRILDHGDDEGIPYIVMEFLEGESLGARIRRKESLSPDETARIMEGIARGVARAHKAGIVHRDLKPDNVFVTQDEEAGEVVKVVDFGIAKVLDDAALERGEASTDTGATLGTPYYMSPEQVRGKKDIDARSDLWSMAVITFECLTGKRPFVPASVGDLVIKICVDPVPCPSDVGKVPAGFDEWFAKAMGRLPEDRYQSVGDFATTLAEVLSPGRIWIETGSDATRASTLPESRDTAKAASTTPDDPAVLDAHSATQQEATRSVSPADQRSARDRAIRIGASTLLAFAAAVALWFFAFRTTPPVSMQSQTAAATPTSANVNASASSTLTTAPVASAESVPTAATSSSAAASNAPTPSSISSGSIASGAAHGTAQALPDKPKPQSSAHSKPVVTPAPSVNLGI